jgi:hypothetical protein
MAGRSLKKSINCTSELLEYNNETDLLQNPDIFIVEQYKDPETNFTNKTKIWLSGAEYLKYECLKYDGDFDIVSNKITGHGTWFYEIGDKYTGQWLDNMRTGQGQYHYSDGQTYSGSF